MTSDNGEAAQRLKELRERSGLSIREIARRMGLPPSGYNHYETRFKKQYLPMEFAQSVARAFSGSGVDPAEVLSLAGGGLRAPAINKKDGRRPDLIPVYDVAASAGHGALVDYEAIAYSLAFPPNYIRKLTSGSPRNLAIISVKGESMEPTLKDDDIVMLDASKTSLSFDGLFVLRFGDALHVKRIGRSGRRGHITVISDNRAVYPPQEFAEEEIVVIGKVIWYGRKV